MKTVVLIDSSCSMGCVHCFCGNRPGNIDNGKKIALEIAGNPEYKGILYPTLFSERCFDIHEILGQTGGLISREELIYTNDARIGRYKTVEISLHGADAETHALITRKQNSFSLVLRTIEEWRTNFPGVEIHVVCVTHKKNFRQMVKVTELCANLGVDYLDFIKLSWLGKAKHLGPEWFLDRNDIRQVVRICEKLVKRWQGKMNITLTCNWGMSGEFSEEIKRLRDTGGIETEKSLAAYWWSESTCCSTLYGEDEPWYKKFMCCNAGRGRIAVDSHSRKIYPCFCLIADDRFVMGHWQKGRANITYSPFERLLENIGEPCRSCNVLEICGGACRAEAIAEKERTTGKLDLFAGLTNCRQYL